MIDCDKGLIEAKSSL